MPRTQIEKLWLGGAVVLGLLIAVIGYFFLVGPQRTRTQDVQSQVSDARLQATTLQTRIVSLTSQQKQLAAYRTKLTRAREALPTVDDLSANPALLRSLQSIAHSSSTSVSSLTIGDPTAITPATPTTSDTSASPSSTASPSSIVTTAPAASLYSVAITASVSGSTNGLTSFLTRLQHHQPRAVLISGVTIGGASTSGATSSKETMSLTMTAFVRPAATPAASALAPTPSPTDTP